MGPQPSRRCGPCVACCDGSLRITVDGEAVYPGKPCPHCTGTGCAIYGRHPRDPCRRFVCGWLAPKSPLPEWLRPDKAGLVLLPAELRWQEREVDVAVPTGAGPAREALAWLTQFSERLRRPLLYQAGGEWFAVGPPEFQAEIKMRLERGETIWR